MNRRVARPDSVDGDVAELLTMATPPSGHTPGTIEVLAHHPPLLGPFLTWAAALALHGALPRRDHEVLALRAAYVCRSAFEWGEHVGFAKRAGLTDAEIERIAAGPSAPGWSRRDAALVRAADELLDRHHLSEAVWNELRVTYTDAELVEIVYVVGQYTMLSMVANAFGIDANPGMPALP